MVRDRAEPSRTRLVVVVYPQNHDGSPGNFLVDQAIRATFEAGSSERIEIYNEYLDVSRSLNEGGRRLQAEYLRKKYRATEDRRRDRRARSRARFCGQSP